MKILHVINIRWWNAASEYGFNIMKCLKEQGHENICICGINSPIIERCKELGIEYLDILPKSELRYLRKKLLNWIMQSVKSVNIIFAHTGKDHSLAYILKKKVFTNAQVVRIRIDARSPKKTILLSRLFYNTSLIVVPSIKEERNLIKKGLASEKKIFILKGTFIKDDVTDCNEEEIRHKFKIPDSRIVISQVGRLSPVKGHIFAIKALGLLKKKYDKKNFIYIIAGKEKQVKYSDLEYVAVSEGVSDNIRFLDHVQNIQEIFKISNIGIVPSIGSEMYSRVIIEFFSFGVPVIAFDVGIIPEFVKNGYNGFCLKVRDYNSLTDKLNFVMTGEKRLKEFSNNAGHSFENEFSYKTFYKRVKSLISILN